MDYKLSYLNLKFKIRAFCVWANKIPRFNLIRVMSTWKITAAISAAYCYFAYFLHEPFLNMYKHSFRESWLYILDSHELTETMIQITLLLTLRVRFFGRIRKRICDPRSYGFFDAKETQNPKKDYFVLTRQAGGTQYIYQNDISLVLP